MRRSFTAGHHHDKTTHSPRPRNPVAVQVAVEMLGWAVERLVAVESWGGGGIMHDGVVGLIVSEGEETPSKPRRVPPSSRNPAQPTMGGT